MTAPNSLVKAIARAVEQAGGDMDDVAALVATWERLDRYLDCRADLMRGEAQTVRCCCETPAEPAPDGRCSRCWGRLGAER